MCGIAGIVQTNTNIGENKFYQDLIKKMTDKIIHRGPDSEGHEYFNNCILGFRRLAIIDTSSNGNQPMLSSDKKKCIVFNGEIYNYKELKKNLSYNYSNSTDTEVILALFNKEEDIEIKEKLNMLNGMFAFALWNEEKKELFCARDRFGQKPFFYAIGKNGEFIFGSEIKSILSTNLVSKEINPEALSHFLKYAHLHPEQSIFKNINVLPPSSFLIYKDNKISIERYWNTDLVKNNNPTEEDAIETIKKLAFDAVEKQLNSDVPVGAFLSGGYDSGTVVSIASQFHPNINTISFGYQDQMNELPLAKEISDKYKTNHTEVKTDLDFVGTLIENVYSRLDEPNADSAIPASYLINQEARKRMTVVLSGNAGDELFGGYNWYNKEYDILNTKNKKIKLNILKGLNVFADKLGFNNFHQRTTKQITALKYNSIINYHRNNILIYFKDSELNNIVKTKTDFEYNFPFTLDENDLNTCIKMDLHNTFSGGYLVKDDRISMLNSVEIRIPFLDNNLVDYVINLNYRYKVDHDSKKKIFKKTFGYLLTPNILNKPKQGFGGPINHWLKVEHLQKLTEEILKNKNSKIFEYLNYDECQKYLKNDYKHWTLIILGIWMRDNL